MTKIDVSCHFRDPCRVSGGCAVKGSYAMREAGCFSASKYTDHSAEIDQCTTRLANQFRTQAFADSSVQGRLSVLGVVHGCGMRREQSALLFSTRQSREIEETSTILTSLFYFYSLAQ